MIDAELNDFSNDPLMDCRNYVRYIDERYSDDLSIDFSVGRGEDGHYFLKEGNNVSDPNSNKKARIHAKNIRTQMLIDDVQQKLADQLNETGRLTRKDIWDAFGVRFAHDHNSNGVLMTNKQSDELNDDVLNAIQFVCDNAYLPSMLPWGLIPERLWRNADNGYTTVEWSDGTTTSVSAEDPYTATPYGGFCACVAKKLYGSTSRAIKHMDIADRRAQWPAKKKRIEREKRKKLKAEREAERRKLMKQNRERWIRDEIEQIYIRREAERRVAEANTREEDAQ